MTPRAVSDAIRPVSGAALEPGLREVLRESCAEVLLQPGGGQGAVAGEGTDTGLVRCDAVGELGPVSLYEP
jgi:hypothetical protein